MTPAFAVVAILAIAAAFWICRPLWGRGATDAERVVARASVEVEMQSRHGMVMAPLRDLEEDRATGKIGDEDYADLHGRLTAQAVKILKRIDELSAEREATMAARTLQHPGARNQPDVS